MFNPRKLFPIGESVSYSIHKEHNRQFIDPANLEEFTPIYRKDSIVLRHNNIGYMKEEVPLQKHVQVCIL